MMMLLNLGQHTWQTCGFHSKVYHTTKDNYFCTSNKCHKIN